MWGGGKCDSGELWVTRFTDALNYASPPTPTLLLRATPPTVGRHEPAVYIPVGMHAPDPTFAHHAASARLQRN